MFGAERRGCKRGFLSAHRVGIVECREPQAIQAPEQQADARMQDIENFPKMGKEILTQVQETQRVPNRIKPRRYFLQFQSEFGNKELMI